MLADIPIRQERAHTKTWDGLELALHCRMRNPRVASVSRMPSVALGDPIENIEGLLSRLPLIAGQRGCEFAPRAGGLGLMNDSKTASLFPWDQEVAYAVYRFGSGVSHCPYAGNKALFTLRQTVIKGVGAMQMPNCIPVT